MPKTPKHRRQQTRFDPNRGSKPPEMVEMVDGAWVLKALGAVIGFALVCAYVTLCVLFSHAQWQLVLKPSRVVAATPASVNLAFTEVHFGVDASGQPQLDGWWIAGDASSDPAVLMLHGGDGTMADALPQARSLHDAGLNVLVFDYRGYGRSGGQHPVEASMESDAESALSYLTARGVPAASILVYGAGAGGALAVRLGAGHPQIAGVILESPNGDFKTKVAHDPRAGLVPFRLLFNQDFPLAEPLRTLTVPKLLISYTRGAAPGEFQTAADPKTTVELPGRDEAALHQALTRFLSAYVAHPPGLLTPQQ